MTSLAFVLGVLPLALASGAGAAARRSMGTGVLGGMLAATFVATLFVPLFFRLLSRETKPIQQEASAAYWSFCSGKSSVRATTSRSLIGLPYCPALVLPRSGHGHPSPM